MYTFYTDKTEVFECSVSLQGAKVSDSKVRLVLESQDYNLVFYGTLTEEGRCTIPVKRLKTILPENTKGTVKLEVIAEDTYFEPWQDVFEVKTNKKVTVEVKSNNKESSKVITEAVIEKSVKVDVPVKQHQTLDKVTEQFVAILRKKGVSLHNIKEHKDLLMKVGTILAEKHSLKKEDIPTLIGNITNKLLK